MKHVYVTAVITLSILFALPAHGQQMPEIAISEINWAGSSASQADEWIELFNASGEAVDLGGWILAGAASSGDALELEGGAQIPADGTLVISNYPVGHEKTTLLKTDLSTTSLSLSNSGMEILLTTPEGVVVDEAVFSGRPEAGSTDPHASAERDLDTGAWKTASESMNLSDAAQLGTPGAVVVQSVNEPESEDAEPVQEPEEEPEPDPEEPEEKELEEPDPVPEEDAEPDVTDESSTDQSAELDANTTDAEPKTEPPAEDTSVEPTGTVSAEPEEPVESVESESGDASSESVEVQEETAVTTEETEPASQEPEEDAEDEPAAEPEPEPVSETETPEPVSEPLAEPAEEESAPTEETEPPEPVEDEAVTSAEEDAAFTIDPTLEPYTDPEPEPDSESTQSAEPVSETETEQDPEMETEPVLVDTSAQTTNEESTTKPAEEEPAVETEAFTPGVLLLNELVSNPQDGTEWIEITNPGAAAVELDNWSVRDATGKSTTFTGTITPGGYAVVNDPSGVLNNNGDTVELVDPAGNIIDVVTYGEDPPAPDKGESLALHSDGDWRISTKLTKKLPNQFPGLSVTQPTYDPINHTNKSDPVEDREQTQPEPVPDDQQKRTGSGNDISEEPKTHRVIAIAKDSNQISSTKSQTKTKSQVTKQTSQTNDSGIVERSGIITAAPGTFGKQIAFMDTAMIYFYHAEWPDLQVGDIVVVTGELGTARGEERIKIASAHDMRVTGHTTLTPLELAVEDALAASEGALVKISGEPIERSGDKLILRGNSGEITVVANGRTGIDWSEVTGPVEITGIIRHLNENTRLYPRKPGDITVKEAVPEKDEQESKDTIIAPTAGTTKTIPWIGGGMLASTVLALVVWYMRARSQFNTVQPI